jgi:hypothetical protein
LITDGWSWTAGAVLAFLLLAAVATTIHEAGGRRPRAGRTRVDQTATGGGRIVDAPIRARRGAEVTVTARDRGLIRRAATTARSATVHRTADAGGIISDADVDARDT